MQVDRHTNTYQFFIYCVKCGKKGEVVLPEKRALEIAQMKCSCETEKPVIKPVPFKFPTIKESSARELGRRAREVVREIVIPKPAKTTYTSEKKHFDKKTVTSTIRKKR